MSEPLSPSPCLPLPPSPSSTLFRLGQWVVWPRSPSGFAQVDELRRTRLALLYHRGGRICRAIVRADRVAEQQRLQPTLFEMPDNPLGRGVLKREKRYGG